MVLNLINNYVEKSSTAPGVLKIVHLVRLQALLSEASFVLHPCCAYHLKFEYSLCGGQSKLFYSYAEYTFSQVLKMLGLIRFLNSFVLLAIEL
jgi:hypothetical protein